MKSVAHTDCYFYGEDHEHGATIVYCEEATGLYECPCNITYYNEWDKPEPYDCPKYITKDEVSKIIRNLYSKKKKYEIGEYMNDER